jgi:hypothetical protein
VKCAHHTRALSLPFVLLVLLLPSIGMAPKRKTAPSNGSLKLSATPGGSDEELPSGQPSAKVPKTSSATDDQKREGDSGAGGGGGGGAPLKMATPEELRSDLDEARAEQLKDFKDFGFFDTALSTLSKEAVKSMVDGAIAHVMASHGVDSVTKRVNACADFAPCPRPLDPSSASALFGFLYDIRAMRLYYESLPRDAPDFFKTLPSVEAIGCMEELARRAVNASDNAARSPTLAQDK